MRLTEQQRTVISTVLHRHFGQQSLILLFGSRTNDQAKGGDIDIYIEPAITDADLLVEARLQALADLHQQLGEQKIDLVINRKQGRQLPIYNVARQTGITL